MGDWKQIIGFNWGAGSECPPRNFNATYELTLKDMLSRDNAEKWASNNKNAIKAYDKFVDENECVC